MRASSLFQNLYAHDANGRRLVRILGKTYVGEKGYSRFVQTLDLHKANSQQNESKKE